MSAEEVASPDEKPNFGGKYVLARNENLDPFLAANGTIKWRNHMLTYMQIVYTAWCRL